MTVCLNTFKTKVRHNGKCAYLLADGELEERIETTLQNVELLL